VPEAVTALPIRRFVHRLSIEHDRLDDLLEDLERMLRTGDQVAAAQRLSSFTARFDRYVQGEERFLFAVLETGDGPHATTGPMRREHGFLRRLVSSLCDAVRRSDPGKGLAVLASLRSVFLLHHAKEEWLIHPLLAAAVGPTTEDAVLRWLIDP
jgi:hemerythrin-like domain-containing protein